MALGDPYVTAAELKSHLGITDAGDDTRITRAVNSASRNIEQFCRRQFNTDDAVTTRRFRSANTRRAIIDDFHTATGLIVRVGTIGAFNTTLTVDTEFIAGPFDSQTETPDVWPFWRLRARSGRSPFTCVGLGDDEEPNLEVVANWGWATVPEDIIQAAMLHATRLYRRKDSPDGLVGGFEANVPIRISSKMDSDAVNLIGPFRKHRAGMF